LARRSRPPARATAPPPAEQTFTCKHFGVCGSCSLLDQPVAWQLHDKVEATERLLAPLLGDLRIEHELPERPQKHFRTRLLFPVRNGPDGLPIAGMYEFKSHSLVRIEQCMTIDAWLTALGRAAEAIVRELRLPAFLPGSNRGTIKALWARLASGTGEVLAGLVTRPGTFPDGPAFAEALQAAAAKLPQASRPRRLVGVVHSISDRDSDFVLGDRHVPLRGHDHVVDERDGLTFRISAGSFYQIHAGAHALLYRPALAMCGDVTGQSVVDGYGGVGAVGLRFAKAGAKAVTIVEDGASACRDAEHNAAANELAQVTVRRASFASAELPAEPDLLVVDPPRIGLQRAGVERVLQSRPRRLLYVACSAEALARDLAPLCADRYRLTAVRLCDLFPHTEHVELLALLERG
jgi:23S rRNA (uracil1939-C5)-methyltransferase